MRGYEILSLKAEFFKDENGYIWLFNVKDLHYREQRALNGGTVATILSASDLKKKQQEEKEEKERQRK